VTLALGEVVYEAGSRPEYVYFPTGAVVSLLYTMEDGATAEVGLTGNDGIVGVALFLGGDTTPNRAIVQIAGGALRMRARLLQDEFARGGPVQQLLLRYTQALITQISQTAVCNRLHAVEKRLCRWLLLSHDCVQSDQLAMTQEFIANMLGGRRESVTVAAARLQDAGLIQYSRGHITILDRPGLEVAACECYRIVRDEFDRLLNTRRVEQPAHQTPQLIEVGWPRGIGVLPNSHFRSLGHRQHAEHHNRHVRLQAPASANTAGAGRHLRAGLVEADQNEIGLTQDRRRDCLSLVPRRIDKITVRQQQRFDAVTNLGIIGNHQDCRTTFGVVPHTASSFLPGISHFSAAAAHNNGMLCSSTRLCPSALTRRSIGLTD
jgi:CRP-like cAMP-binding protein